MKGWIAALCLLTFSLCSPAADRTAFGASSCAVWMRLDRPAEVEVWLLGYVSGLNAAWPEEDVLKKAYSANEIFSLMDVYCKANPNASLEAGAQALFASLINRQ